MTTIRGKCSWFGGPQDMGVSSSEDLAWWETWDQVVRDGAEELFLPQQPPGTTGLARRLNPEAFYIACRWNYDETPKTMLPDMLVHVRSPKTGRQYLAYPSDWGPNESTGRIADLSPGLMEALGITTDEQVEITYPYDQEEQVPTVAITVSGDVKITVNGIVVHPQ